MKIIITIAFVLINSTFGYSQEKNLVKYFRGFMLNEGIYLNFLNFQQNSPIPKSSFLTEYDKNSIHFYDQLFENKKIYLITKHQDTISIETEAIWGYSVNGFAYIQLNGYFSRIHQIGALSHFVGKKVIIPNNYVDPSSSYWRNQTLRTQSTKEVAQEFILDFKSGVIVEFDLNPLEELLNYDKDLFIEFNNLSQKKKRQLKFFYLKKFNQRNPIYFPLN